MQRRHLLSLAAWPLALPAPAAALEVPQGAVVLSLIGRVNLTNRSGGADFDMTMLEQLPNTSFTTHTPWYREPRKFSGPLLRDLLVATGARGSLLKARALNDYEVEIPMEDVQRHDVLVARLLDDKPMTVRDKGPLFIIYPFDKDSALRRTIYYSRCAWQLRTIEVA